jgi:hypothetical protein
LSYTPATCMLPLDPILGVWQYRPVIYTLTTPIIVYFVFSYFLPRTSILVLYKDTRTYICYSLLKFLRICIVLWYVLMSSFTLTSYEWCGDLWNILATLFPFDDIDIRCTLSIPLVNILLMPLNHVCCFRYPLFWNLPIDGSTTLTCHLGSCHPLALTLKMRLTNVMLLFSLLLLMIMMNHVVK